MSNHKTKKTLVTIGIGWAFLLLGLAMLVIVDYLLGLGVFFSLAAKPDPYLEMARSRVQIGDRRDDAVRALSDAWFHTECRIDDGATIRDMFFYSPRDRDRVRIVLVVSKETNGTASVAFVGLEESYMLHLHDQCTPSILEAFGANIPVPSATP